MQSKKIALVTGASRGIGKDIALKLAESNMNLILTYRDEKDKAYAVAKQTEALGAKVQVIQLDMSHFKTMQQLILSVKNDQTCLNNITYLNSKGQSRKLGKNIITNIIKFLL